MRFPSPTELLRVTPAPPWLLVVGLVLWGCVPAEPEWTQGDGYSWRSLTVPSTGQVGFRLADSARAGIDFVNSLDPEKSVFNRTLADGSGVAVGDVDGDSTM